MTLSTSVPTHEVWSRIYEEYWRKFDGITQGSLVEDEELQGTMRDAMMSITPQWQEIETYEDLSAAIFDTREVMELTLKAESQRRQGAS